MYDPSFGYTVNTNIGAQSGSTIVMTIQDYYGLVSKISNYYQTLMYKQALDQYGSTSNV